MKISQEILIFGEKADLFNLKQIFVGLLNSLIGKTHNAFLRYAILCYGVIALIDYVWSEML